MPLTLRITSLTGHLGGLTRAAIFFSLMLVSSCTLLPQAFPPEAPPAPSKAEQLFLEGKYREARLIYQQAYDDPSSDAGERNRALYGLACTQIVLAQTDSELFLGIDSLNKWDKGQDPARSPTENSRLLVLAVSEQGKALAKRSRELLRQINRKDRIIANQKEKTAELTDIIEALRKQLDELEAIDEIFQEKKKTL